MSNLNAVKERNIKGKIKCKYQKDLKERKADGHTKGLKRGAKEGLSEDSK